MLVQDLITRSPVVARPSAAVAQVAWLMKKRNVGSVIVAEESDVVGIVTDRDIVLALVDSEGDAWNRSVAEIMTALPATIEAGEDVEACLDTMESFGVRRLPVVDEEKALLGVVSLDDILVHLGRSFAMAGGLIRSEVTAGV